MTLILGIDPGSRITGYGVVRDNGRNCEYVASGCIRTGSGELAARLQAVFVGVSEVITWAVSCLARCALNAFIERHASPPVSVASAKERRCHE